MSDFAWRCPSCGGDVDARGDEGCCRGCGTTYRREGGIWRFLRAERERAFAGFLAEYATVRRTEGWGSSTSTYYRALPWVSEADPQAPIWRIRAASYATFLDRVVVPRERQRGRPLTILDLGAGNCWLSNRLAQRGHQVAAVDVSTDPVDGLGARVHYLDGAGSKHMTAFTAVQAEFDRLPFQGNQADLIVYNGSFHYSVDCARTLREARRMLCADGAVVILDSPFFRDPASGAAMVREREGFFERTYGFRANRLPCVGYLTETRLTDLAREVGLAWTSIPVGGPWRGVLANAVARLRGQRERASFPVLVGQPDRTPPAPLRAGGGISPLSRAGCEAPAGGSGVSFSRQIGRAFARLVLRGRFRLFQRHRYRRLVVERVGGRPFVVLPDVFNPKLFRSGEFLARALAGEVIPEGATVLDLGTGSGVGAVAAAGRARRVVAVDLNPEAVRCARINVLLNRVEDRVEVRLGDLFAATPGERFDVILFNPPYFRGVPRDALDLAWRSVDVVERFAAELSHHLAPEGWALVVLSTDGDATAFLDAFRRQKLRIDVVVARDLLNETLTLYAVRPGE